MPFFFKSSSHSKENPLSTRKRLAEWGLKNTPKFGIHGKFIARCIKVYDGDTCTVAFFLREDDEVPVQINCRMSGYDSPEIGKAKTVKEKEEGKKCRDALSALIFEKDVIVDFSDTHEKWGRGLGTIWINWDESIVTKIGNYTIPTTMSIDHTDTTCMLNINQWMIENTLCSVYNGGTKTSFEQMCLDFENKKKKILERSLTLF